MPEKRNVHKRSLLPVYKVLLILLLCVPFMKLSFGYTVELYAVAGDNQSVQTFMMTGTLAFACGAFCTSALAKRLKNLRMIAMIGSLLMVPFQFVFWSFATADTSVTSPPDLNAWFWRAYLTALVGQFGYGMLLSAALAYVGKWYTLSHNTSTGRIVGSFNLYIPFMSVALMVFAQAYQSTDTNWTVLGAVMGMFSAAAWHFLPPVCTTSHAFEKFQEQKGTWDQMHKYLVMFSPLTACATFYLLGQTKFQALVLDEKVMAWVIGFSANLSALVFFGKGFDHLKDDNAKSNAAQQVWNVFALLTAVMCLVEQQGASVNLNVLTVCLCNFCATGGVVFYMSHMMHNSDYSEISTAVAFYSLFSFALFFTMFFFCFFGSLLQCIFLLLTVTLTNCQTKFMPHPRNDSSYANHLRF